MTILKESPEIYIQKCEKCGAVLQYSLNDIYVKDKGHYIGGVQMICDFDFIVCPSCGEKLFATKER